MATALLLLLCCADARWERSELAGEGLATLREAPSEGIAARHFGALPFGAGRLRVAVAGELLWIDVNRDGMLADERPRAGSKEGDGYRHDARIELLLPGAERPQPLVLEVRWGGDAISWRHDQVLRGGVEFGERWRLFECEDRNGDFRIDGADALRIDLDGDGRLGPDERFPLPEAPCRVTVEGLTVDLAFDGESSLRRPTPEARGSALDQARRAGGDRAAAKASVAVLGLCGDAAAVEAALAAALRHGREVAEECERLLSLARGRAAVLALVRALDGESAGLALRILSRIPSAEATDGLCGRLAVERDVAVQRALLAATIDRSDARVPAHWLRLTRAQAGDDVTLAVAALRHAGFERAAPRGALLLLLEGRSWEDRVYALDALRDVRESSIAAVCGACLGHSVWQVRIAAAEALGRIRLKASVGPLVEAVGAERHERVRNAIARSLEALTGESLGIRADLWRKWWERWGAAFAPSPSPKAPKTRPPGETKTVATFYGIPVLSDRVVFVIDESSSMAHEGRYDVAVSELLLAAGRLGADARLNVIAFQSHVWQWERRMQPMAKAALARLGKELRARIPAGETCLYDALERALDDEEVETIFLLSDGAPNAGRITAPTDIMAEVRRRNQLRRATIHCVSIGDDSSLLRSIAAANGGDYVRR